MRVGIFQCAAGGLSQQERLNKLASVLSEVRTDIVVCPELFMSGYNIGESLLELAEAQDGPFARQVADLATSSGTAILYGYPERDDTRVYNSALYIDNKGRQIANHRKLLLPPGFESEIFNSGEGLTLFTLNGVPCAILICYDAEFPEAVRAVTDAGASIVFVPTALVDSWGLVAFKIMPTRAFENGVWLVYANHAGTENQANYLGSSCIVAPDGKDAVRAGAEETLIWADLDMQRVTTARSRLPYGQDAERLRKIVGV